MESSVKSSPPSTAQNSNAYKENPGKNLKKKKSYKKEKTQKNFDKNQLNTLINGVKLGELLKTKTVFNLAGNYFVVDKKYEVIKRLGQGAYGVVCSCKNKENGKIVAIKKITNAFNDLIDAKRIVREIKLIHMLNHPCIIKLLDLEKPDDLNNFNDIYFTTEYMDTDLHKVIYSNQQLTNNHFKYFMYQIICGVNYLHSANVIHRDLKPANILINKDCRIKICDFGLGRGGIDTANSLNSSSQDEGGMTEYVITRWYRAPEVILKPSKYSKAVDIWSIGCIFAELLGRTTLFPGENYLDQIKKITAILGTPRQADVAYVDSEEAMKFLNSLPKRHKTPFAHIYQNADPLAIDLLEKTLKFNPTERLTAEQCLEHEYFSELREKDMEKKATEAVDWSFDKVKLTKINLQKMIYEMSLIFHPLEKGEN